MLKINYKNEQGNDCECVFYQPEHIDHTWWSHGRDLDGKFSKHPVTSFHTLLDKIPGKFTVKYIKNS